MADDIATVAVTQHSLASAVDTGRSISTSLPAVSFADRADHGVEIFSRWAGILAFGCAIAAIVWLIV